MTTYYKAVRQDGTSFHDPCFRWLPKGWRSGDPIPEGWTVEHPNYRRDSGAAGYLSVSVSGAAGYLSVSVTPTDCTGMDWPCILLEVEPLGEVFTPDPYRLPNKRAGFAFKIVRELPATDALGPQGVYVAALIKRSRQLTEGDVQRLATMNDDAPAWNYAMAAVLRANATRGAAMTATRDAAMAAAWIVTDAAIALVVRDLITRQDYDALTRPWRSAIGPIHPDDDL